MKTSQYPLIILLLSLFACSDTVDTEYSSLEVARKENAIRTGLVPEWLPPSAEQIKVAFNIQTNEKILAFHFTTAEAWTLPDTCEQIDSADPPEPRLSRSWWPDDVPAHNGSAPRHAFFACENGESFLAVHPKMGQAFYWNSKY